MNGIAPLCEHNQVRVVWHEANEPDGEISQETRDSDCVLFIGGKVYIGRTKCEAECGLYLPDHDPASQKAFQYILKDENARKLKAVNAT